MNIEQYLLTCGAEECAEIAQSMSKASRFGLDDRFPGRNTNPRQDIIREYNDLVAVIELMQVNGLLPLGDLISTELVEAKKEKISRMMLYSADRGRVRGTQTDTDEHGVAAPPAMTRTSIPAPQDI